MARLTNAAGVVVNVDDDTAARLGSEWKPVEAARPETVKRPARQKKTGTDEK